MYCSTYVTIARGHTYNPDHTFEYFPIFACNSFLRLKNRDHEIELRIRETYQMKSAYDWNMFSLTFPLFIRERKNWLRKFARYTNILVGKIILAHL